MKSKPTPGDLYIFDFTSEAPITVRAAINPMNNNISTIKTMTVNKLHIVAVARSDGSYSFQEIRAVL